MADKGEATISEMNRLLAEGPLSGVYLFYGPEEYFKDFYCNKIKEKTVGTDILNYTKYTVKTDPAEVIRNCSGYPMFADWKMIVLCESGFFCGKADPGGLTDFLGDLPPSTVLVFRESQADKRSKLYKAVERNGVIFHCDRQSDEMIIKLLAKAARAQERGITKEAAQLMILGLGEDMQRLLSELNKLVLLTAPGDVIGETHVREVCTLSISAKIWDLTDAIAENHKEKAYIYLSSLLDAREAPQMILFSVTKAFMNLYNAKMLQAEGMKFHEIASALGSREFVVKKMCQQARKFSAKELSARIEFCIRMDETSKTGKIQAVRALELIVAK